MQTFARVVNGVVTVVEHVPDGMTPGVDIFIPSYAAELVSVPSPQAGSVSSGWTYVSGTFAPPVISLTAAQLQAYANAHVLALLAQERSYDLGGGVSVMCDASDRSAGNLSGINSWGAAHPNDSTHWIDNEETVKSITGTQAQALALAVSTYAQSVWNVRGTVALAISAGSITSTAQIDAASWPV